MMTSSTGSTERTATRVARRRSGVTLVEIMIGLVIASIVGGAVTAVLTSQQRFYMRASSTLDARSQVRQALTLLPADLASISPADGDLLTMLDTAVDVRTTIGAAVACSVTPSGTGGILDLAPSREDAATRSGFSADPQIGDAVMILDDNTGNFVTTTVTAVASGATVCASGAFSTAVSTAARWRLTVAGTLTTGTVAAMPVRVTRRVRYALYRETDGEWYLGRQMALAGAGAGLGTRQMVGGPYVAANAVGTGGLMLRYRNTAGAIVPTSSPTTVARIDITVRGDSAVMARGSARTSEDSVSVALRNRF